jgi:CheY-like chemotaxis protein
LYGAVSTYFISRLLHASPRYSPASQASLPGDLVDTQNDTVRRLLVVDDEPVQCPIVTRAMTAFGFAADSAASIEEASSRITRHAYDVIILDLSLGAREGISLLRLIAASPADPVVIFITRLDDRVRAASIRLAAELGLRVAGALSKPVGPSALRAMLDSPPPHRIRHREQHPAPPPPTNCGTRSISARSSPSTSPRSRWRTGRSSASKHLPDGGIHRAVRSHRSCSSRLPSRAASSCR